MDLLFRKRAVSKGTKPMVKIFSKIQPIAPSMMRRPLVGVGGAGIRRMPEVAEFGTRPLVGVGGAGIRRIY